MDRETVIRVLKDHADEIRARGASALYLFGSTVRDEAAPDSDVDLFVDKRDPRTFSLITLIGLKHFLEDMLGADVDLVTREGLHPRLRADIEAQAQRVI
jgi:predicted nucleotidyltransferase